jgi:hypothetical protein
MAITVEIEERHWCFVGLIPRTADSFVDDNKKKATAGHGVVEVEKRISPLRCSR